MRKNKKRIYTFEEDKLVFRGLLSESGSDFSLSICDFIFKRFILVKTSSTSGNVVLLSQPWHKHTQRSRVKALPICLGL